MMHRFRFPLLSVTGVLLIAAIASCKLPSYPRDVPPPVVPAQFVSGGDTLSSGTAPRKLFYASDLLNQLIDTVLYHNYDYRITLQRIEMVRAAVRQSQAVRLPQVNAQVAPSLRKFGLYTMDGAGNIVTDIEKGKLVPVDLPDFYLGFQASWEIDLWGKLKQRNKAALARLMASEEGRKLMQTALVTETASAYYALMAEDQILKTLDESIRLQEQAIQTVRIQKATAVVNELAVQQFEAQGLSMKAMRAEAQQRINQLENRISLLTGGYSRPIKRDSLFFDRDKLPILKAGVPSLLLLNRPDIRQMEWELKAAKADLIAARAAFLPEFRLTGGWGMQAYRTGLWFVSPESMAYSLLGGLTAPMFNRKGIQAEYLRMNAQQKEVLLHYEKTINRAYLEVDQELRNLSLLDEIYQLKTRERDVLSSSVLVAAELFRTGRANYLEVLMARQLALRSGMELIDTRMKQYLSSVRLYQSLGGGWQ